MVLFWEGWNALELKKWSRTLWTILYNMIDSTFVSLCQHPQTFTQEIPSRSSDILAKPTQQVPRAIKTCAAEDENELSQAYASICPHRMR